MSMKFIISWTDGILEVSNSHDGLFLRLSEPDGKTSVGAPLTNGEAMALAACLRQYIIDNTIDIDVQEEWLNKQYAIPDGIVEFKNLDCEPPKPNKEIASP